MWPFNKKGSARIAQATAWIDKTIQKLDKGIEECFARVAANEQEIVRLNSDSDAQHEAAHAAEALLIKLEQLKLV